MRIQERERADGEMSARANGVFYASSYHPIQAGSIDGTDITPHDNAVYRAFLASSAGLYDATGDPKVEGDPYCTLFVGCLSENTDERSLAEVMRKYGRVKRLRLVRHIVTGASRGYAFVEYETEKEMLHAYETAYHTMVDGHQILVDYNRQQLMPGWIPRRLGGGLGGKKESGQLRFGGRERPFRAPLRPIPHDELRKLGIPLPPNGHYMTRFQVPPPPRRKFERHAMDSDSYHPLGTGQNSDERVEPRNTPEAHRDYSDADFDHGRKRHVDENSDEFESDINNVVIHQAEYKEKIDHSIQGRTASKDRRDWEWDADVGEGERSRWHWKESEKDVRVRSREDSKRRHNEQELKHQIEGEEDKVLCERYKGPLNHRSFGDFDRQGQNLREKSDSDSHFQDGGRSRRHEKNHKRQYVMDRNRSHHGQKSTHQRKDSEKTSSAEKDKGKMGFRSCTPDKYLHSEAVEHKDEGLSMLWEVELQQIQGKELKERGRTELHGMEDRKRESREYFSDVGDGNHDRNYSDLKPTHERNDGSETSRGRHRHHSNRERLQTHSFEENPGHRKKHKHREHGH